MTPPFSLTREKTIEVEVSEPKFKKKSEQVEIEDPVYKKLKESEKTPLLINTGSHTYTGRLQDTKINDTNNYFIIINTGKSFRVLPISYWYRFSQKVPYETLTLEEAEAKMAKSEKWIMKKKEEKENGDKDIDFEIEFDDDDGEEYIFEEEEEKELDIAGEEMKKLVKNYEESSEEKKTTELRYENIREAFIKMPISVRELLSEIKRKFVIDDRGKQMIRDFIKKECNCKIDSELKEKILWFKK